MTTTTVDYTIHKAIVKDGKRTTLCGELGFMISLSYRVNCTKCQKLMKGGLR